MKTYRLHCEYCGWTLIANGNDPIAKSLYVVQDAIIPGGIPKIDPETKELAVPKEYKRKKKFRCPQCGRCVTAKNVKEKNGKEDQSD